MKEFLTSKEAQVYFGYQCCWSTLCRYCRENGRYKGYYWQYRMVKERKSKEEEVIGKSLRVQQSGIGGEWLEGKINAFDPETGRHAILYDSGTIEYHALEDIHFEWKNDHGQKPVEKLDLKTGMVLGTFDSIADAATSMSRPGVSTTIYSVCKNQTRSSCGFFWRYKGSDNLPPKPKGKRSVQQLCLETGRVLGTFDLIAAAGNAVGITTPGISFCCNGRNGSKSAGGFGWRFHTVDEQVNISFSSLYWPVHFPSSP